MKHWLRRWFWRIAAVLATVIALLLGLRVHQSERQPDLAAWHTWVPDEPNAREIDTLDWQAWMQKEDALFTAVDAHMQRALEPEDRVPANRYFDGSPLYPAHFTHNWNRSYVLTPAGEPIGAVVLLHGLSDSPYSLRHVAQLYVQRGFVAVGIRLPGHGTVPAALTAVRWEDWRAATRLAVREARRLAGPGKPLHVVGYSNGAALAVQYAVNATQDAGLAQPQRVVLFSPMIGLTRFARYSGFAGWPSALPAFSKSAWLEIVPEFNPFKYNSFPVNAARQSYQLTQALSEDLAAATQKGANARLPPVLAFQSVVDSTVIGSAVFTGLFARLPPNGSEIVLFDVNRAAPLELLLSRTTLGLLEQTIPPGPRIYRVTVLGDSHGDSQMTERSLPPGDARAEVRRLDLHYPGEFFSLSHVATPFPPSDSLYGSDPDDDNYGIHLGNQALRGERGTFINGADSLLRASCNPFFSYVAQRIDAGIASDSRAVLP